MKNLIKLIISVLIFSVFCTGFVFAASSDMKMHSMMESNKIGELIRKSAMGGYTLSYHFMDLRDEKTNIQEKTAMDKPHHLMVYITDKNNKPVLKGKVGFMIKNAQGITQKAMGMFMSEGFGTTADMKQKGVYTISSKAILGDKKLVDKFEYEIR
jgi:hypothetical protein